MVMIYHITPKNCWHTAQEDGVYQADSLSTEGFIHCSTAGQVLRTANRFFKGQQGLFLLCINDRQVEARLRYENLEGGSDLFPHIYGPLNLSAVTQALVFEPQPDGTFKLPEEVK
jgi:uncharacterized protein (DUF952 family)